MRDAVLIRVALPDDIPVISEMSSALATDSTGPQATPERVFRGVRAVLLRPENGTYFLALVEGQVVGQIMLTREWNDHLNGWTAWMRRLFVRPEHRGIGIGRALCKYLISAATDAVEYKCNVYGGNDVSTGLFESLGFQFVARNGIFPAGHAELTTGPTTNRSLAGIAIANNQ